MFCFSARQGSVYLNEVELKPSNRNSRNLTILVCSFRPPEGGSEDRFLHFACALGWDRNNVIIKY